MLVPKAKQEGFVEFPALIDWSAQAGGQRRRRFGARTSPQLNEGGQPAYRFDSAKKMITVCPTDQMLMNTRAGLAKL